MAIILIALSAIFGVRKWKTKPSRVGSAQSVQKDPQVCGGVIHFMFILFLSSFPVFFLKSFPYFTGRGFRLQILDISLATVDS